MKYVEYSPLYGVAGTNVTVGWLTHIFIEIFLKNLKYTNALKKKSFSIGILFKIFFIWVEKLKN